MEENTPTSLENSCTRPCLIPCFFFYIRIRLNEMDWTGTVTLAGTIKKSKKSSSISIRRQVLTISSFTFFYTYADRPRFYINDDDCRFMFHLFYTYSRMWTGGPLVFYGKTLLRILTSSDDMPLEKNRHFSSLFQADREGSDSCRK